jgi:hypothetical protein
MQPQRTSQDRLVAAGAGAVGALAVALGSLLPAFDPGLLPALQGNTLVQASTGIYLLFAAVIAFRVYRAFTGRYQPGWLMFLGVWVGGWLVYDATTMTWVNPVSSASFVPAPGIGVYVVGLGAILTIGSGLALWRIGRSEAAQDTIAPQPARTRGAQTSALSAWASEIDRGK